MRNTIWATATIMAKEFHKTTMRLSNGTKEQPNKENLTHKTIWASATRMAKGYPKIYKRPLSYTENLLNKAMNLPSRI